MQVEQLQSDPQLQSMQVQFGLAQMLFFVSCAHWHIADVFIMI
jgi:hypothetical protein